MIFITQGLKQSADVMIEKDKTGFSVSPERIVFENGELQYEWGLCKKNSRCRATDHCTTATIHS